MFCAPLLAAAFLLVGRAVADECSFEKGLDIPPQFQSAVTTFCERVLKSSCSASGKNAPPPLAGILGSAGKAEISSVCSCLLSHCHTSTSKPTTTTTTTGPAPATSTCSASTLTVSVTPTFCTASSRPSVTVSTATVTVTATNTVSETPPTVTDTVVATATHIVSETASTITDTVTATATDRTTATQTVTLPGTTVTVTATTVAVPPSPGPVDQNGCPAVQGSSVFDFVIYCSSTGGGGSFSYGTNPGYSIEDCSGQCYDDIIGGDCLAVTYTPPATGAFSPIDGHLEPGVCTFYEFVTFPVPSTQGVVLGVFQNDFAGKRRKVRRA